MRIFLSITLLLIVLFSCKKNQLNGKSTIKGKVVHHSKAIANATVFIKFNAKDFPGTDTTVYDAKVRADASGNYEVKCYKGDYFLFGKGIDNAASPPNVIGGIPIHIRNNETVDADIAVTED